MAKEIRPTSEPEKTAPAAVAEPIARAQADDEFSYQDMVDNAGALFGVPGFVLAGAALNSKLDITKPMTKATMKTAIAVYMAKEVT